MHNLKFEIENNKKTTLLSIHGYAGDKNFLNNIKNLRHSFNVISFDLNYSEIDLLSISHFANIINYNVQKNNLQNFFVLGHSLGAAIALKIRGAKKIICMSPFHPYTRLTKTWLMPSNLDQSILAVKNLVYDFQETFQSENSINLFAKKHLMFTQRNKIKLESFATKELFNQKFLHHTLMLMYKEVACPLSFIHGDSDKYVTLSSTKKLVDKLNCQDLHIIKKCGHLPAFEKPAEVIDVLEKILSK